MRGESYGKLDMRKLHRSQTDLKMFKLKYRFPDGFPDTAILVDMSGSMSGKQAEEVITAATSLAIVVKCRVWSYAEHSSEIKLVKLDDGKITHTSAPGGNTPSGIALVGVAETLRPGGLIIHLTDGEHNVEFGPAEATQVLDKKGDQCRPSAVGQARRTLCRLAVQGSGQRSGRLPRCPLLDSGGAAASGRTRGGLAHAVAPAHRDPLTGDTDCPDHPNGRYLSTGPRSRSYLRYRDHSIAPGQPASWRGRRPAYCRRSC